MANSYPLPLEDVPASQIYLAKDVRKCGFLKKKAGGFKIPIFQDKYDNRYFIIHKGWAYYYKNEKSERPQGKISLQGYSSMVVNAEEEEATMPFVFKVFNKKSTERTWYFATDNQLEKDQWMEAFKLEIERYNVPKDSGYFRGSTSCPVAPTHDRAHPQQNHKSASVNSPIFHNSPVSHNPPVSSNFGSSGIGSSVSSVFPEENYEPVDQENEVFQPSSIPVQPTVPDWPHDLPRRSPPHPPSSNNIKSNVSPPVPVKPGWIRPSPSNQVQPSVSDISNRPPLPPPKRSSPGSPQSNMKFGQPNSKLAKPGTVDPSSPQSVTTFSPQHNVTPFRSPFAERNPMPTLQLNPKSLTRHDERYYEENYTDTSLQPQYDENIGDGELMESTSYCSVEQPDSEVSYDMPEMDTMDLPKNGGMDKMNSYPSNPSETMPVKYYNTRNLDSGNVHDVMSKDMPIVTAGSKTTKELNSAGLGKLVPNSDSSSTTPEWLLKLKSKPKNVIVGSNDGNASLSKTTFSPTAKSQPKPYPSTPKVASPPFTGVSSHKTEDIKPPWVKTTNPSKPPIPQKPGHKIGAKGAQRPPPPPNKPVVGSVSALKSRFDQQ